MNRPYVGHISIVPQGPDSIQSKFESSGPMGWITIGEQVSIHLCGPEEFEVFAFTMQASLKQAAEFFCNRLHADGERENELDEAGLRPDGTDEWGAYSDERAPEFNSQSAADKEASDL